MLIIPPPKFRKRDRPEAVPSQLPALDLTLLAAGYDPVGLILLLTFDRAVDVDGFDPTQVTMFDAQTNHMRYASGSATAVGNAAVSITLVATGTAHGSGVGFEATDSTGIVAMDDGGTWPGIGLSALPFSQ